MNEEFLRLLPIVGAAATLPRMFVHLNGYRVAVAMAVRTLQSWG